MQYQIPFNDHEVIPFVAHDFFEFFTPVDISTLRSYAEDKDKRLRSFSFDECNQLKDLWPCLGGVLLDRFKERLLLECDSRLTDLALKDLSELAAKRFGGSPVEHRAAVFQLCFQPRAVELTADEKHEAPSWCTGNALRLELVISDFKESWYDFKQPSRLLNEVLHEMKLNGVRRLKRLEHPVYSALGSARASEPVKTAKGRYTDSNGLPRIEVKGSEVDPVEIKIRITDDRMIERIAQEKVGSKKSAQEVVALDYEFLYRFWLSKQ